MTINVLKPRRPEETDEEWDRRVAEYGESVRQAEQELARLRARIGRRVGKQR